jgi:hypothetical protein
MSWHSEPGATRVSVTAHSDHDGTTVRVAVDRTSLFIPFAVMASFVILSVFWISVGDSFSDLLELLVVPAGGLAVARALWASSSRAIEERTTALLDAVSRSLPDQRGESEE